MTRKLGLLLLTLTLPLATLAAPPRKVEVKPILKSRSRSSTGRPATVSRESPETLRANGYVPLSRLTVERVTRRCMHGPSRWLPLLRRDDCKDYSYKSSATAELAEEASKRGAELVTVEEDTVETREKKWAVCTEEEETGTTTKETRTTTSIKRETTHYYRCVKQETETRTDTVSVTRGMIWRHDPVFAAVLQKRDDFLRAAGDGRVDDLRQMLSDGLDSNTTDLDGNQALAVAAASGQIAAIEFLVQSGARVDLPGNGGTPLMVAASRGNVAGMRTLLSLGANARWHDRRGVTPLLKAAGSHSVGAVKLLLDAKVDPLSEDGDGRTALWLAAEAGDAESCSVLLASGANPNHRAGEEYQMATPLMMAALSRDSATIRLLVAAGADPSATDSLGATAFEYVRVQAKTFDPAYLLVMGIIYGRCNYYDLDGKLVLRTPYNLADEFSEGLAKVGWWDSLFARSGFIDKTGALVIPFKFFHTGKFSEGLAVAHSDPDGLGSTGYLDKTGAWAIRPQFDHGREFSEGLAPVRIKNKWGYIDRNGALVIPPRFDDAKPFSEGLAVVGKAGKGLFSWSHTYGVIDRSGKWIIEQKFGALGRFVDGLAPAQLGEGGKLKRGFIDRTGKMVIEGANFFGVSEYSEGVGRVFLRDKGEGFVDRSGTPLSPFAFTWMSPLSQGMATATLKHEHPTVSHHWVIIDTTGKVRFDLSSIAPSILKIPDPFPYARASAVSEGLVSFCVSGKEYLEAEKNGF